MVSASFPVTITSGIALSTNANLGGFRAVGLVIPTLNGTPNIGFRAARFTYSLYVNVFKEDGTALIIPSAGVAAATNAILVFDAETQAYLAGLRNLRLRTIDDGGSAVNQSATRTITIIGVKD